MTALKLTQVGNSVGVILPKELLTKLGVGKGDTLFAIDTPDGVRLTAADPEFESQMAVARRIMKRRRAALREPRRVMVRLSNRTVLSIHDEQLAEHGGATRLRDAGLLESTLARPLNQAGYGDSA